MECFFLCGHGKAFLQLETLVQSVRRSVGLRRFHSADVSLGDFFAVSIQLASWQAASFRCNMCALLAKRRFGTNG